MKKALLCLLAAALPLLSQGIRMDPTPVMKTAGNVGPGAYPQLLAVPGAQVSVCGYPANGLPCTNYATTYSDSTTVTQCPTNAQVTLASSNVCVSNADSRGNFGFWLAQGNYAYTTCFAGTCYGPYPITIPNSSISFPIGVTVGGTSRTSLPANQILLGNGTGPVGSLAPNTTGLLNTLPLGPTGIYDVVRFDAGGYPQNAEFGAGTIPVAQSLVGTLKIADNSTIGHASAVAGYAQSGGGTAVGGAVGVYGEGRLGAVNGAWGANFNVSNYTSTHADGFAGNTWGIEVDMNNSGTGSPANSQFGISAVTAAFQSPSQQYVGFSAEQAASGGFQPFKIGFHSQPGASVVAFKASERDITASSSPSQPYIWCSRDAGAVERCGQLISDINGNASLQAAATRAVFLGDATGTGYLAASATGTQLLSGRYQGILFTPASSSSPCTTGEFGDDAGFHYVCVATNTWKRVAIATW